MVPSVVDVNSKSHLMKSWLLLAATYCYHISNLQNLFLLLAFSYYDKKLQSSKWSLKAGVSNSNTLKGRMSMKKCSVGKGKSALRAAVYRGRLWMPHILSNMMLFLSKLFLFFFFQSSFLAISSIKVPTFSIKFYTFLNFELKVGCINTLGGPRVWDPWLKETLTNIKKNLIIFRQIVPCFL